MRTLLNKQSKNGTSAILRRFALVMLSAALPVIYPAAAQADEKKDSFQLGTGEVGTPTNPNMLNACTGEGEAYDYSIGNCKTTKSQDKAQPIPTLPVQNPMTPEERAAAARNKAPDDRSAGIKVQLDAAEAEKQRRKELEVELARLKGERDKVHELAKKKGLVIFKACFDAYDKYLKADQEYKNQKLNGTKQATPPANISTYFAANKISTPCYCHQMLCGLRKQVPRVEEIFGNNGTVSEKVGCRPLILSTNKDRPYACREASTGKIARNPYDDAQQAKKDSFNLDFLNAENMKLLTNLGTAAAVGYGMYLNATQQAQNNGSVNPGLPVTGPAPIPAAAIGQNGVQYADPAGASSGNTDVEAIAQAPGSDPIAGDLGKFGNNGRRPGNALGDTSGFGKFGLSKKGKPVQSRASAGGGGGGGGGGPAPRSGGGPRGQDPGLDLKGSATHYANKGGAGARSFTGSGLFDDGPGDREGNLRKLVDGMFGPEDGQTGGETSLAGSVFEGQEGNEPWIPSREIASNGDKDASTIRQIEVNPLFRRTTAMLVKVYNDGFYIPAIEAAAREAEENGAESDEDQTLSI